MLHKTFSCSPDRATFTPEADGGTKGVILCSIRPPTELPNVTQVKRVKEALDSNQEAELFTVAAELTVLACSLSEVCVCVKNILRSV